MASLLENAFDFISRNENKISPTYQAYWDVRRYSIGFGTISFAGEVITYETAKKRSMAHITGDIQFLEKNYPKWRTLNENQKIAVLDYAYQYGGTGFLNSNFRNKIDKNEVLNYEWAQATQYPERNKKRVDKYNSQGINTAGVIFFLILFGILVLIKKKWI